MLSACGVMTYMSLLESLLHSYTQPSARGVPKGLEKMERGVCIGDPVASCAEPLADGAAQATVMDTVSPVSAAPQAHGGCSVGSHLLFLPSIITGDGCPGLPSRPAALQRRTQ